MVARSQPAVTTGAGTGRWVPVHGSDNMRYALNFKIYYKNIIYNNLFEYKNNL